MRFVNLFLCTLIGCLPVLVRGQGKSWIFRTFNTTNGLSQNTVSQVMQDREGTIWLATQVGIDKITGDHIENVKGFNKKLTEDLTLLYDYDDRHILVATGERNALINKWVPDSTKSLQFPIVNIRHISPLSNDTLLIFTRQNIYLTDQKFKWHKTRKPSFDAISSILPAGNAQFYIGTTQGLYHYDAKTDKLTSLDKRLPVNALCFNADSSGIFVGFNSLFVRLFMRSSNDYDRTFHIEPDHEAEPYRSVTSFFLENDSMLWTGTRNAGLHVFNVNRKHEQYLIKKPGTEINCIYLSKDGVIWVGTNTAGISFRQPDRQRLRHYFDNSYLQKIIDKIEPGPKVPASLNNNVWSILPLAKDSILLGTNGNGIALLNPFLDRIVNWIPAEDASKKPIHQVVYCLLADQKQVLLATEGGLFRWTPGRHQKTYERVTINQRPVLADTSLSILNYDASKTYLLAGSKHGSDLYILDRDFQRIATCRLSNAGERLSLVFNVNSFQHGFTIVGTTSGLYRFNPNTRTLTLLTDSTKHTHFISAYQRPYNDTLWVGTDRQGLQVYTLTPSLKLVANYQQKDGLPDEVIYAIAGDRLGNYWFSTNHGIYRFSHGKGFNSYDNDDITSLHEFNTGSFAAMGDSILLFGGVNGISYLKPLTTINRAADTIFRPVLRCIHPSGNKQIPLDSSYIDFNLEVNEHSNRISLIYKFGYLELYPMLGQHQNPANTHFEVRLNGQLVDRREDGRFLINEEQLRPTFRFLGWDRLRIGNNTLSIRYRTAMGEWRELPPIYIDRFWLTGSNWITVALVLALFIASFFIARELLNAKLIRVLNDKTIEITRIDDIGKLGNTSLTHLLKGLKFDYAVISFVDFDDYSIKGAYGDSGKSSISNPRDWLHLSSYPLDHDDILAQVAYTGESIRMYKNEDLSNKKIRITPHLFNREITEKYKHKNLARLYMPVIDRSARNAGKTIANDSYDPQAGDVVLGVIEAGYKTGYRISLSLFLLKPLSSIAALFSPKIGAFKLMELQCNRLKLYIESFARSYTAAYTRSQQEEMESLIRDIDNTYDLHKLPGEFLETSLAALGKKMSVFKANIALNTYNMEEIDFTDEAFFYNCTKVEMMHKLEENKERNKGRKGIMRWVAEYKIADYSGDVYNDPRYVMAFTEAQSELSIPMLSDNNTLLGVIDFLSEHPYYFNAVLLKYCWFGVQKMTEIYIRRKQYKAFQEIVPSFESYSHTEEDIYNGVVATLKKYFFADHISVWTRESNDSLAFLLHDSTLEPLRSAYRNQEQPFIRSLMSKDYEAGEPLVELLQVDEKDNSIGRFCRKEGHHFKFYILLKVVIDNKYQAFINIFSRWKRSPDALQVPLGLSSFNRSFLTEIVKKIATTTQTNRLWRFIRDVSLSLSQRDISNAQQTIVNEAYLLMPSVASVVLFSYTKDSPVKLTDALEAGIKMEHIGDGQRSAHLANLIVVTKTEWIETREDYKLLADLADPSGSPTRELFWDKYNLQSVAVLRLQSQNVPIGVMFFNYTTPQRFENGNSDTARLIKAFANLAEISLINEDLVRRIENERNQSGIAKEEAEKRARETYEKMMNILPFSTRASLFSIVQQVNHEIINQLQFVSLHLIRMRNTSERWYNKDRIDLLENIKLVDGNIERCSELVLLFEPSAFKNTVEDLNAIVRLTAGLFIKKQSVDDEQITSFDLSGLQPVPVIYCVKAEISMIIYNVIANAEKAIGEKRQKIKFSASIALSTAYDERQGKYIFSISDNGIGMDNKVRQQIFQLGFTTRPQEKGKPDISKIHGIGLHFVEQCLEKNYDGQITCESKKNIGTTFTMKFSNYSSPE